MASCKNCGHNSSFHTDHIGKPDSCIECKAEGKVCKGFKVGD